MLQAATLAIFAQETGLHKLPPSHIAGSGGLGPEHRRVLFTALQPPTQGRRGNAEQAGRRRCRIRLTIQVFIVQRRPPFLRTWSLRYSRRKLASANSPQSHCRIQWARAGAPAGTVHGPATIRFSAPPEDLAIAFPQSDSKVKRLLENHWRHSSNASSNCKPRTYRRHPL